MPVVNSYDGNTPTIDADFNTWGGELNTALGQIDTTLDNFVTAINATETALLRGGGTMTGDLVLASVGPTNARSAGYRGAAVVEFSDNKTLALTDAALTQRMIGSNARTLTIPPVASVAFPVGTVIPIRNSTGVAMTIARGSGVVLTIVGTATDANATLGARGQGILFHEATNNWTISGVGVS
jgi:hypothetical protein